MMIEFNEIKKRICEISKKKIQIRKRAMNTFRILYNSCILQLAQFSFRKKRATSSSKKNYDVLLHVITRLDNKFIYRN